MLNPANILPDTQDRPTVAHLTTTEPANAPQFHDPATKAATPANLPQVAPLTASVPAAPSLVPLELIAFVKDRKINGVTVTAAVGDIDRGFAVHLLTPDVIVLVVREGHEMDDANELVRLIEGYPSATVTVTDLDGTRHEDPVCVVAEGGAEFRFLTFCKSSTEGGPDDEAR